MKPTDEPSPSPRTDGTPAERRRGRVFTAKHRELLRQFAMLNRPWEHSTGPRTAAGKARVAENGRKRQKGEESVRQIRRNVALARRWVRALAASDPFLDESGQ